MCTGSRSLGLLGMNWASKTLRFFYREFATWAKMELYAQETDCHGEYMGIMKT